MGRNKPCVARHVESVVGFEITVEVHDFPPFLSRLLFMISYHCISYGFSWSVLIFINSKKMLPALSVCLGAMSTKLFLVDPFPRQFTSFPFSLPLKQSLFIFQISSKSTGPRAVG